MEKGYGKVNKSNVPRDTGFSTISSVCHHNSLIVIIEYKYTIQYNTTSQYFLLFLSFSSCWLRFPFPIPPYSITQKDKTMDGAPTTSGSGGGGGPAPFLLKTYEMVDDSKTDEIVSWSSNKNSFVVWNPPEFARVLLPTYFKHNNFSSFIRQLNTYVCFSLCFRF